MWETTAPPITDRCYAREQNRPRVQPRRRASRCPVITASDIRLADPAPVQDDLDRRPHLLADTPRRIP